MKPDEIMTQATVLAPEDVLARAVQFFTNSSWRAQSQTNRIATFVGVPKIPVIRILFGILLLFCLLVPGIIYYFLVLRRLRRLQNIVVTTTPTASGCEVVVSFSPAARRMAAAFLNALPVTQATTV